MKRQAAICFALAALACLIFRPGTAVAQNTLQWQDIVSIVRSQALEPVSQPVRQGDNYVVRAVNGQGQEVMVSVRPAQDPDEVEIVYEVVPPDPEGRVVYAPRRAQAAPAAVAEPAPSRRAKVAKKITSKKSASTKVTSRKSAREERAERARVKSAARKPARQVEKASRPAPATKRVRLQPKRDIAQPAPRAEPPTRAEPTATIAPAPRREPPARAEPTATVQPAPRAEPPVVRAEPPVRTEPPALRVEPVPAAKVAEPETTATTPPAAPIREVAPRPRRENPPEAVSPRRRIIDPDRDNASYPRGQGRD